MAKRQRRCGLRIPGRKKCVRSQKGSSWLKCLGLKIEMSGVYNQGEVNKVELAHEVLMGKKFF